MGIFEASIAMKKPFLAVVFFSLSLSPVLSSEGHGECVWYDVCGWDQDYGPDGGNRMHFLNCHYSGPAIPASQQQVDLVKEVCPHLYTEGEKLNLCCSLRQLRDLKENFATPQQLIEETCPTCWYNFRKNFCDMTCSSHHSKFIRADNLVDGPGFDLGDGDYTGENVTMVKNITYFAHTDFVTDVYESCKNVQFPVVSDTIMFMLCGVWGSKECNPFRWFDFLGSVDNGLEPFQVSYDYSNDVVSEDGHHYHNPEVVPCNMAAPGYEQGCGCEDCMFSHCYDN